MLTVGVVILLSYLLYLLEIKAFWPLKRYLVAKAVTTVALSCVIEQYYIH